MEAEGYDFYETYLTVSELPTPSYAQRLGQFSVVTMKPPRLSN